MFVNVKKIAHLGTVELLINKNYIEIFNVKNKTIQLSSKEIFLVDNPKEIEEALTQRET